MVILTVVEDDPWQEFKQWLRASFKQSTFEEYLWRTEKFREALHIQKPEELNALTSTSITRYLGTLGSSRSYAYAIINLLKFHGLDALANRVPTPVTYVQKIPEWLPEPVIQQVLIDKHAPDSRMSALAAVTYDLGLRAEEVLMLNVGPGNVGTPWIDLETGHANIFREKTRAFPWQTHKLSGWAKEKLLAHISQGQKGAPLFTSKQSQASRMTYDAMHAQWGFWMEDLGTTNLKHHFLRHSKLTWMAVEGKDLVDIMRFAGHSNLGSTSIYLHMGQAFKNNPLSSIESIKESKIYEEAEQALGV